MTRSRHNHRPGVEVPPDVSAGVTFLTLAENRLAHTAAEQLQQNHARGSARLVYVYGPSGVGKSLRVRRFLREERRQNRTAVIAHVTGHGLAAELAEASESRTIPQFQSRYRSCDVLVCEDVHELIGRPETQYQLLAALDHLLGGGARVLITSRCAPGELSDFLPRLVNRFRGGVCVSMKLPGPASRLQLIEHFAQCRQIPISSEAAGLLAEGLSVSPRELEAAVAQLEMMSRHAGEPLDARFVRRYLDGEVKPSPVSLADVTRAVAAHFHVRQQDLRSPKRSQHLLLPRQCAMVLARELTGASLTAIASYLGRSNHSTAVHAAARMKKLVEEQPSVRVHLEQIRHLVEGRTRRSC